MKNVLSDIWKGGDFFTEYSAFGRKQNYCIMNRVRLPYVLPVFPLKSPIPLGRLLAGSKDVSVFVPLQINLHT